MRLSSVLARVIPSVGARSVLFGAHWWLVHPAFVFAAWWRLYGFPRDPRLWVAFFLHDLGYLFQWCHDMDGADGERHPEWSAGVMGRLFGQEWHDFTLYHSRFYAKRHGRPFSRLCVADKLAFGLTPRWLYLPLVILTGEIWEYMQRADERRDAGEKTLHGTRMAGSTPAQWYARVEAHMTAWALEHVDGREDTWTPDMGRRVALDESGVWS